MSEFEVSDEAVDPAEIVHAHRRPRAVAFVPDLIDRSKVDAAVGGVRFVARAAALDGCQATLVIVDLSRNGALDVLPAIHAGRLIGFAPHVDEATLASARAAGCEAMPRSEFFQRLPEIALRRE
jgi:hypothetical protein